MQPGDYFNDLFSLFCPDGSCNSVSSAESEELYFGEKNNDKTLTLGQNMEATKNNPAHLEQFSSRLLIPFESKTPTFLETSRVSFNKLLTLERSSSASFDHKEEINDGKKCMFT